MQRVLRIWNSIALKKKFVLFAGMMVALLAAIACSGLFTIFRYIRHAGTAMDQSRTVNTAMMVFSEEIKQFQKYITYSTKRPSAEYELSRKQTQDAIDALGSLSSVNVEYSLLVRAIRVSYGNYSEACTETCELQRAGFSHIGEYYDALTTAEYIHTYFQDLLQLITEKNLIVQEREYLRLQSFQWIVGGIFGASVLVSLLFCFLLFRYTIKPLQQLSYMVERFTRGELDIPDLRIDNADEIGWLIKLFNNMKTIFRSQLESLIEKNRVEKQLISEKLEKEQAHHLLEQARLTTLQAQINPHFLFNTLNIIVRTAEAEQAGETSVLIHNLAALLRYTLQNQNSRGALTAELTALNNYTDLMSKRFGDRIRFELRCHVDPERFSIPIMVLQPLVENAIQHGVGRKETGGGVRIVIRQVGTILLLRIVDNGPGMSLQRLQEIRDRLDSDDFPERSGSSVGLSNVYHRVRLLYPESTFSIYSRQNLGTVVEIRLQEVTGA